MPDIDPNLPDGDVNDEGQANPAAGTSRFYTQEEFDAERERVRAQERDKLHGRISQTDDRFKALQSEVSDLRKIAKSAEKAEADRLAAIEKERKKAEEAELSAKDLIERRQAEYNTQLELIRQEQAQQVALVQKELEYTRLQAYIQRRVNEESDNIAPELLDFIDGNTPEAVEASIERVKAKTSQIVENMRQAGIRHRAQMPGVAPASGANGVTPMDAPGDRQLTDKDIAAMDMKQFGALREKLGMDRMSSNTGLFGGF
jgi:hypothetical protein